MPVGYGFCESTTKTIQLIRHVKQWLLQISASGLILVALYMIRVDQIWQQLIVSLMRQT